ncbi:MAG TPA: bifunctional DNA-formamidopyrimidine glycosylase/DNA-(apurinic or apyrimidinic site) lyase [Patescibacteria group bacterium]|nr:bifunctional DNA-formamidopyrimidine glycosylase/DNA-(apurinic or apyrimidinic site) lyase [Patescibacteria group bacterium]
MPELPEVESIRIQLQRFLVGHEIKEVVINYSKTLKEEDKKNIIGANIKKVRRFGKALVIDLSNSYSIVAHVKMTGQFIYRGPNLKNPRPLSKKVVGGLPGLPAEVLLSRTKAGKHTHVIFTLDRGGVLYFNDYRKFGWMRLVKSKELTDDSFIGKLGKEFLKDLNENEFSEILLRSKKPIKLLLMDQGKMAGVGNIYANDALWLAGINPRKKSLSLSLSLRKKLFESIESVLKQGIKRGGASELAFVTPDGGEGKYQDFTLVYGREGEPCKVCKTPIKKIKLGGRGTYFCPACQS